MSIWGLKWAIMGWNDYKPTDGLGHLLMFPVEELEKNSERLLKILEEDWINADIVVKDGNWAKVWLHGEIDARTFAILSEFSETNRAIRISQMLPEQLFTVMRNIFLSEGVYASIDSKTWIRLRWLLHAMCWSYEKLNPDFLIKILELANDYSKNEDSNLSSKTLTEAEDEIVKFENEKSDGDTPSIYKHVFLDLFSELLLQADKNNQMTSNKRNFLSNIETLNKLWETGNLEDFHSYIDKITEKLPESNVQAYKEFIKPVEPSKKFPNLSPKKIGKKLSSYLIAKLWDKGITT